MKQIKNNKIALFALGLLLSINGFASVKPTKNLDIDFKLISSVNNKPVMQLNFLDNKIANYNVEISDESGIVLYNENIKSNVSSTKFLLDTEELGNAILTFTITDNKSGNSKTYTVKPNDYIL